jgi:transaldolase/glucose-6-phosphate isomerase
MDDLARTGISIKEVTDKLTDDGVRLFADAFHKLLAAGREKHAAKRKNRVSRLKTSLPESLAAAVKAAIGDWQSGSKMQRLWHRDAALWTGDDEASWQGRSSTRHGRIKPVSGSSEDDVRQD